MKRKNTARNTLFTSIISLLLCATMLVGATFAWFTDKVESGINTIAAGNLDVALYHGKTADPTQEVTESTALFTDPNGKLIKHWEPGVVAYTNLKVANLGTLALKYQMSVNTTAMNYVQYEDGSVYTLADTLQVAVVKGGFTGGRAEAQKLAAEGEMVPLNSKEESDTYGIVIYWEPSQDDNLFNINNGKKTSDGKPLTVTLGINLFATQEMYEQDSFDETYDKGTEVFTVPDAQARLDANEDVTLTNCVDMGGILVIPANYTGKLILNDSAIKSVQGLGNVDLTILGDVTVNARGTGASVLAAEQERFDGSAITANGELTITGNGNLTAIAADQKGAFGIGGMNVTKLTIQNVHIANAKGSFVQPDFVSDPKYGKSEPEGGAAIGSGYDGAVITLNKVTVSNAQGGSKAAGIGARYHTGVTVNITDCQIKNVEGGNASAGIGGSRVSGNAVENGITINILNSVITAVGGQAGAGIGSGYDTHCSGKQPLCTINIDGSIINATGGKYAAGVGTGYHNAALKGEIKNSSITAKSGEKFYKDAYTCAMDIGFGVVDPAREGQQTDSKLIYNGIAIGIPAPGKAVSVSSVEALKAALAEHIPNIYLTANIQAAEVLNVASDVVINGDGYTVSRASGYTGTLMNVGANTTLTVNNTVFDGSGAAATGNLIATTGNGSIVLNAGTVAQNNHGAHAISLATRGGGSLTLNGAYVINNSSDSGAIWGGGQITVNDGSKINNNSSTGSAGAIRMVSACNLTMNGGQISNNTAAGSGGAIWGYGSSTYHFNGGTMANNTAASGGAIYTGDSSVVNIGGTFELIDNTADDAGALRLSNRTSFNMTGGKIEGNVSVNNEESDGFYGWNPGVMISGGELVDDITIQGGLTPTVGGDGIVGVIHFHLSTNHNTANLLKDFGTIRFTVAEGNNFAAFNFKPAADYTYCEGDEARLVCVNEGYETYWDAATGIFKLKAK